MQTQGSRCRDAVYMMPLLIVSGIYLAVITLLLLCIVKNGIKLKNAANPQEARQYFYTALIMLVFVSASLAVILLRSNSVVVLSDFGMRSAAGVLAVKKSFAYVLWFAAAVVVIILLGLFDWFVLRKTAKTSHRYRIRKFLVFGAGIVCLLCMVFAIKFFA